MIREPIEIPICQWNFTAIASGFLVYSKKKPNKTKQQKNCGVHSQNYGTAEVGRQHRTLPSLTSLLKPRSTCACRSRPCPVTFVTVSRNGLSTISLGLVTPIMTWNFLHFSLGLFPPVLSLDTTEKSPALPSSLPPSGIYAHWHDSPKPSLLQAKQSELPQRLFIWQTPQSINHLCGPPLDSYQHAHISLVPRSPDLDTIPDVSRRGEGSLPSDSACWLQSAQSSEAKGTKYLQGWGHHTIPGEPVSMFDHSHIKQNLPFDSEDPVL